MTFLEKNLEDIIFETPNELLHERGFFLFGKKKRQVRIGNYGIADVITWYRCDNKLFINILELKKDRISIDTFLQAVGYVQGIRHYLSRRGFTHDVSFKIKLIGKEIDNLSTFCYLPDIYPSIELITYTYEFDGISFHSQHGYTLTNNGFGFSQKAIENSNVTEDEPF